MRPFLHTHTRGLDRATHIVCMLSVVGFLSVNKWSSCPVPVGYPLIRLRGCRWVRVQSQTALSRRWYFLPTSLALHWGMCYLGLWSFRLLIVWRALSQGLTKCSVSLPLKLLWNCIVFLNKVQSVWTTPEMYENTFVTSPSELALFHFTLSRVNKYSVAGMIKW